MQAGGVGFENKFDLLPNSPERLENFFVTSLGVRWIVKAPMIAANLSWIHRARLVGVAADGDHGVYILTKKVMHVLGTMTGDIDADFRHHFNRQRMNVSHRFGSGALYIQQVPGSLPQNTFRHVTTTGVSRAENQCERFFSHDPAW